MRRALLPVVVTAALAVATACSAGGGGSTTAPASASGAAGTRPTTTTTVVAPSAAPTTSGGIEPVRRASALCESLTAPDDAERRSVLSAVPTVAGAVASELAAAGVAPAPWDGLAPDHFVAVCVLSGAPTAAAPPPTVVCADGAVVLAAPTQSLYADEEGRASDASPVHAADPCTEPAPLP